MSVRVKLIQAAQKEAALQRPVPYQAHASESLPRGGEVQASVRVADYDRFTKMVEEVKVEVARGHSPPGRSSTVEEKAARFAGSVSYLTEALKHVETDVGGTAVVRSTPETMAGKGSPYFEAKVSDTELTLRRYEPGQGTGKRQAIPFCVTDDQLGRLAEDAAAALSPRKKRGA